MNETDLKHTHVWIPWGSEVDHDWRPINHLVHVKCANVKRGTGGRPCQSVLAMGAAEWLRYRNSLSQYQEATAGGVDGA